MLSMFLKLPFLSLIFLSKLVNFIKLCINEIFARLCDVISKKISMIHIQQGKKSSSINCITLCFKPYELIHAKSGRFNYMI